MIERMKRMVRRHPVITYLAAVLTIIGEACCIACLIYTNSDKIPFLAVPSLLVAWVIQVAEMARMDEETKRDAYIRTIRRISRHNW
jgi:hypothetical protein